MNEITYQRLGLTHEQKARLRELAKQFGFTIGRGAEKDWGSINQFAAAIADGKLTVVKSKENGNQ